jgi:hypothetical protein
LPLWGTVAIIASLVLAIAFLAFVLLTGGSDSPGEESTEVTPTAATDPAVEQLLAYLPPEANGCVEAEVGNEFLGQGAIAVVHCPVLEGGANDDMGFYLYPDEATTETAFQAHLDDGGVARDSGDCASGVTGEEAWSGAGGQGRIACGINAADEGSVWWTSDGYPIVGFIAPRDQRTIAEVYEIWQGISDYSRTAA